MPRSVPAILQVHVAERIFPPDDVGQELVTADGIILGGVGADPDADAGDRPENRDPASINARVPPQTLAMEVDPFDSMISLVTRMA